MSGTEIFGYGAAAFFIGLAVGLVVRSIVEFIAKAIDH